MNKYLEFQQVPFKGKTKKFKIISKKRNCFLGRIEWYSHYRQYSFAPMSFTVWNKECLKEIQEFLQELKEKID